jgi:hypothetical protein
MKALIAAAYAALTGLVVLACPPAMADEKAASAELAKMLEVGWGTTSQFRAAGNKQAAAALAASGRSPQSLYAAAVMLIKQGRYAEAQQLVDDLLKSDAAHLPGLRAQVWLATILKDYEVAMTSADRLAEVLGSGEAENVDEEALNREHVSFLGRIYGFLGGPAAANVNLGERKAAERKLVERLTEGRRVVFEDSRDAVLQKHLELTDAKDAKAEAARDAAEDAKAKTLDDIASQREERANRLKELEERSDKLKGELKDELAEIAKSDRPLAAELATLERRATLLNRELLTIQSQIGILQSLLGDEKDQFVRARIISDIDRLLIIGSRYDADLLAVNRLASGVQQQRAQLALRQRKAQADVGGQMQRINQEAAEMARREKRSEALEKRAERATPSIPAGAAALRATAAALATYDPFPLEQEKARILAELK